jgi:hypothetical protein
LKTAQLPSGEPLKYRGRAHFQLDRNRRRQSHRIKSVTPKTRFQLYVFTREVIPYEHSRQVVSKLGRKRLVRPCSIAQPQNPNILLRFENTLENADAVVRFEA